MFSFIYVEKLCIVHYLFNFFKHINMKVGAKMAILMHDNISVAEVTLYLGNITGVGKIYCPEHLPIGANKPGPMLWRMLNSWQRERAIPINREQYETYTKYFGGGPLEAAQVSGGLSLTDHYWFREDESVKWEDICYQLNGFSNSFGDYFVLEESGKSLQSGIPATKIAHSPDLNTDGVLKKIWLHTNDGAKLFKFGNYGTSLDCNLLSANEVIGSKIASIMGIEAVSYQTAYLPGINNPVCVCGNFVKEDEEFVTALQIQKHFAGQSVDLYNIFCQLGFEKNVNDMIRLDFVMHNKDRHNKNYGFLRNTKTLEFTRFVPLFDQGSSLNFDTAGNNDDSTKPFKEGRFEQLMMVSEIGNMPSTDILTKIISEIYEEFRVPSTQINMTIEDVKHTEEMWYKAKNEQQKNKTSEEIQSMRLKSPVAEVSDEMLEEMLR